MFIVIVQAKSKLVPNSDWFDAAGFNSRRMANAAIEHFFVEMWSNHEFRVV